MAGVGDRLTVELEIVTPLFLGGADPRGDPELRPPSVRGALRFWWRAWHQAREPSGNVSKLFDEESALFGSTDGASPVVVRVSGQPRLLRMSRAESPAGLNYLMYGMHERSRGGRPVRLQYRPAWAPGPTERVRITLSTRPQRGIAGPLEPGVLAALWCLCNLGGLGARTRRGAGAVRVAGVEGNWPESIPPLDLGAGSPADLRNRLTAALTQLVGPLRGTTPISLDIPSLHPDRTWIGVFPKAWPDWEAALEEVGETMRAFRCRYGLGRPGGDYSAVREFITTGATPRAVRRAAFGLPLQFYYTSLPGDAPEGRKATIAGGAGLDRSASPLHLRVVPLAGGDCAVVALIFVAPLLPAGSRLHLESRRHRATCAVPNQSVLTEYLDAVKAQMGHWLEVRYG